jgi:hypothetical protein
MAHAQQLPWSKRQGFAVLRRPNIGTGWTRVLSQEGSWSHCDLWFSGEPNYIGRQVRILGRLDDIWAIIAQTTIGAGLLWTPTAGDRSGGILYRVRGQPCHGFAVEIREAVGFGALRPARWRLECWGQESDVPTLPDGSLVVSGTVLVPPSEWVPLSGAPVASRVDRIVPCRFKAALVHNLNAAARYLMVFDAVALPPIGTRPPYMPLRIEADRFGNLSPDCCRHNAGLVWAASTTDDTLTASATPDFICTTLSVAP